MTTEVVERKGPMSKITQNTVIPLSLVFLITGGIFWLSKIYFTAEANSSAIQEMQKDLKRIDRTTATIEGLLKSKNTKGGG